MRKKTFFIFSVLFFLGIFLIPVGQAETSATASHAISIVDGIGRTVNLTGPVERVVVYNAYNVELIRGMGKGATIIGVDANIHKVAPYFFTRDQIVGKSQREMNYEKLIELNPQVVITTGNGSWEEAEKKLAPFGIKVIVVNAYYTNEYESNCKLLGKIFDCEAEALKLAEVFAKPILYINSQLKDVKKKRVYFEYRRMGNTTIPGNYFYYMVEYAHADNVFKHAKSVKVTPEAIITENPDYIVKVSDDGVKSRYTPPTYQQQMATLNELKSRPGWDEISAVKKGNILLLSHFVHGKGSKLMGTIYLAKFLYPEHLPDLHPEVIFKEWLEKYEGLDYIKGHTYPAFPLSKPGS